MKKNIKIIGIIITLLFTQFAPIAYAQESTEQPIVTNVKIVTEHFNAPGNVIIQYDIIGPEENYYGDISYSLVDSKNNSVGASVRIISRKNWEKYISSNTLC